MLGGVTGQCASGSSSACITGARKPAMDAIHSASQYQKQNRDTSLSDEDLEELLESIPYHNQIIHSIHEMMTSGCTHVIAR